MDGRRNRGPRMGGHQQLARWCRWRGDADGKGLDRMEVVSLAKTMEIKFTVSGPQIGE